MKAIDPNEVDARIDGCPGPALAPLDQLIIELIEAIWVCERAWALADRVDAAIKYGRN